MTSKGFKFWKTNNKQMATFVDDTSSCGSRLGGGFKYFLLSPLLGEMIHLTNIFQMGTIWAPTSHTWNYNPCKWP